MRIVQLANMYSPKSGGLRTAVDALGAGYIAAGHERILITPAARRSVMEDERGTHITLPGMRVGGGYRMIVRTGAVRRLLDELAPDSVEVSDKATLLTAGPWAREHGVRSVLFSHERLDRMIAARLPGLAKGMPKTLDSAVKGWNIKTAAKFDAVVATSAYAVEEFAKLGIGNLHRIPLGVDLDAFRPSDEPRRAGPVRLAYAGRLSPEKNPQAAVGAAGELADAGIDFRLDLYGDGSYRPTLVKLAAGLPVHFHGYLADRTELARRLAAADVAFAPSPAETFGLAVLEALACGTPVVAAEGGAAPELLAPDTGIAVPPTPGGLAEGALAMLALPAETARAAARRRAEQFPWSATVESMLALHQQLTPDPAAVTRG